MDYYREILETLTMSGHRSCLSHLDSEGFNKLSLLYQKDSTGFTEAVVRLISASTDCLRMMMPGTVESVMEEHILLDIVRDLVWFFNTHSIRDEAIRLAITKLSMSGRITFAHNLREEVVTYLRLF